MTIEDIVENFEKFNAHYDLNLYESRKCFRGKCPIHEGDNDSSLTIYKEGHTSPGNWKCFTGNCHEKYGGNIFGFIRGVLSSKSNKEVSKSSTINWCEDFFGGKYIAPENTLDSKLTNIINRGQSQSIGSFKITKESFLSKLQTPTYFINRGYSERTLNDFSVGLCNNPSKPFYERILVPQFDDEGFVIGALGRSIHEKCNLCGYFHNPEGVCRKSHKWKNTDNFPSYDALYNFYNAKESIDDTGLVIITESSANTWRLYEAGFKMSVGTFGAKFSDSQKNLLDTSLAQTIIVVPDTGKAGQILVKHVEEHCQYTHNLIIIKPSYEDDIGRCNIETVKQIIGPYVERNV